MGNSSVELSYSCHWNKNLGERFRKENTNRHRAWLTKSKLPEAHAQSNLSPGPPYHHTDTLSTNAMETKTWVCSHLIFRFKCKENLHFFFLIIQLRYFSMIVTEEEKLYWNYTLNNQTFWCGICHTLGLHRRESPLCFENEVGITAVRQLFHIAITGTGVIILVLHVTKISAVSLKT